MTKILHLCSEYPPQPVFGLGRYVHELAEAQASEGHDVEVITNSMGGDEHEIIRNRVRICRVHFPPPPKAPGTSAMLLHFNMQVMERCLERGRSARKFDIINAHDWLTAPAGIHLARLLELPLVTSIHDVVFNKVRGRDFGDEDAFIAGIENWACHHSSRVIALSESVRQEVLKAYHATKGLVRVVPGGVGIQPIEAHEIANVQATRRRWATDTADLVLYVGRLDVEKGIPTLLEAARALLQERRNPLCFVLAGTGKHEEPIKRFLRSQNLESTVRLAGYLPFADLRLAYAAADLVVMPSDYEPFGLVALEAQRMGTPVIVSRTGGLAETLETTRGGLSFIPGDAHELAQCMRTLLDQPDLRAELGRRGAEAVRENYAWPTIVKDLNHLYQEVLSEGPPTFKETPPWKHPSLLPSAAKPEPRREPWTDVTVFWDTARSAVLMDVLARLSQSHAFTVLGGSKIHVIPVVSSNAGEKALPKPSDLSNVVWHEQVSADGIRKAISGSAAIVSHVDLMEPLMGTMPADGMHVPIIWLGEKTGLDRNGYQVRDISQLYAVVIKCLCDLRVQQALGSNQGVSDARSWCPPERTKPRIIHVLPQLVTGGAETTLLDLIRGTQDSFEHAILCLGVLEGPLPDEVRACGVRIHQEAPAVVERVFAVLQQEKPDLLHLHSMSYVPGWMPIHRLLKDVPILETEHVVNIGSGHFGPVNRVVCVSKAGQQAHAPYLDVVTLGGTTFDVVYNGIDLKAYQDLPSQEDVRRELGLPLHRPILGRVSALARNKLPDEALAVIPHILQEIPDALFVIVGDGPQREPAEAWVRKHGLTEQVRFLGERRDIPRVLRAFDVFAYYTTKDALGNVIVEALAAGIPVVTTEVEGTPEALGDAPGELVPLDDFPAFAKAVARVLSAYPAPTSRELAGHFSRSHMASEYARIYRELLASKPQEVAADPYCHDGRALLIKFPTRSRPDLFFETLEKYRSMRSGKYPVHFLVTCDRDDTRMNCEAVIRRLDGIPNLTYAFGDSRNKVEAINADMDKAGDYSALLLASDDMVPQVEGYDAMILENMARFFPSGDGVLHFNDGFRGRNLNTLVVMGRKYYERFGYIYQPEYEYLWCDNEFMEVANLLGRQVYLDEVIIRHEHPLNVGRAQDAQNQRDDARFLKDKETYLHRRETLFGLEPRKLLSVLVCTMPARKASFERLKAKLIKQADDAGLGRNVEVLAYIDDGKLPIGTKRNALIERAEGEYVCFVDDDDDVSDRYISDIARELADGVPDVVGFRGLMIGPPGTTPKPFEHSLRHSDWFERNRTYYRPPNHLNPIRRSIAGNYRFREISKEEDKAFSMALVKDGALKTERFIDEPLYLYYPSIFRDENTASRSEKSTKEKILFVLMFRLGDVLCGIPTFKALRKKYPDAHLAWAVMPQYQTLVPACADEVVVHGQQHDNVHTLKVPDGLDKWDRVIEVQPSWHLDEWKKTKLPLVSFIAHLAEEEPDDRRIELELSEGDREQARSMVKGLGSYVVMNAGPHISGPSWSPSQRNEVAQGFRDKGFQVVAVAGQDGETIEGAIPMFGLSFQVVVAVIEQASLYVGNDCGTSWLACAAHQTPKIILVDRSEGRLGYDSYVDCLDDRNIVELPLGTDSQEILRQADLLGVRKMAYAVKVAQSAQECRDELTKEIRALVSTQRPKRILETGTFEGAGTTRILAQALKDFDVHNANFVTIEANPAFAARAQENLQKSGLKPYIEVQVGLSVSRSKLPSVEEIERQFVTEVQGLQLEQDIFVDHEPGRRASLYHAETGHDGSDDLIGQYLDTHNGADLILLDSAGHLGLVEFTYVIERLKNRCFLILDDVHHVKHYQSLRFMKQDARFKIRCESNERFGFCVAEFNP